ncbi:MAG: sigma-70 family RNA polymerase sigma factor [Myxococcales bacterium]
MSEELSQVERGIAAALAAQDARQAAVLTLRSYGPEILGFLIAQLRSDQHAEEVFSMFAEDLWRAVSADLSLRSSMRAYAYALARNAKHRFLARDLKKQRAGVPISDAELMTNLVAEVRSKTATYLATDSKQKLAELRDRLDPDEQALLTLRVDRGLEWLEIAEVFGDTDEPKKAAARYRKRFQVLKERLTQWVREAGLTDSDT